MRKVREGDEEGHVVLYEAGEQESSFDTGDVEMREERVQVGRVGEEGRHERDGAVGSGRGKDDGVSVRREGEGGVKISEMKHLYVLCSACARKNGKKAKDTIGILGKDKCEVCGKVGSMRMASFECPLGVLLLVGEEEKA